ncbi:MAG TPA: rod shape-determining protein MreD [Bacteroidetes bacterium]|nr:rod shape-determining protein MreD [Bacteroidota bacterium]
MIIEILLQLLRFALLVLMQVLVLNHLRLSFIFNPYIYPLFLLLLPLQMRPWMLLLIGFFCGLTIDMFSNTMGMHAAACVLLCYMRPSVLKIIQPASGYEGTDSPTLGHMGVRWFVTYSAILLVIHHLAFFFLETLEFGQIGFMFFKILLSTSLSLLLIVLVELLFTRRK